MSTSLTLVVDNSAAREIGPAVLADAGHDSVENARRVHGGWASHRLRVRRMLSIEDSLAARWSRGAPVRDERGAVTAEYAIVIMAAVAFAGLLVAIMRSGEIRAMLVDLVQNALGSAG